MSKNNFPEKSVLVTGGAGFLGSHLCENLLRMGNTVACLDNLQTGAIENIDHLNASNRFEFIQHDVCDPIEIDGHFDEIYNLACPASPPRYQADPVHTMLTCVLGTKNALDVALINKAKFFQASTSEVYGDPDIHPQPETYRGCVNTIGPRACYDEGKRAAEALCFDYRRQYGLDTRIARIFNTYGPRMMIDDGRVVSNFVTRALRGEPLEIYGNGEQTRSLCFVHDLIDGVRLLMAKNEALPTPVNLGGETEMRVIEIANLILEHTGSKSTIEWKAEADDDPRRRRPDITNAVQHLGWNPSTSLNEGLAITVRWFESALKHRRASAPIADGDHFVAI